MQVNRLWKWTMVRPAVLLALAAFAPLAIYAGFNGYVDLHRRQQDLAAQSIADAQSLVETVDRQMSTAVEDAEILAEAPALDPVRGNLSVFEEVAKRTRQRHADWLAVVLLSPDGSWIYSTEADDNIRPPKARDQASLAEAVRLGRPVVGSVIKGPAGRWGIPVRAPVVRAGHVLYIVTVVLMPDEVRQTISSLHFPAQAIVAVVDGTGHVAARTPEDSRALGRPVNPEAALARARGGGGGYIGRTLDGADTQSFYWVSPVSHWSGHVALPRKVYEAPLRRMLWTTAAGFAVCLLLALALVVLWIRDHEARRRQGAAVEQATRIDALGRLTGGVAHDFNNLLTVIQGNTEILGRRLQGEGQAERPLAAIRTATDRAAKLTRQLLVFARGGPTEPSPVDLARKIVELQGALSQLAGTGVTIVIDLEPGLPPVMVDPLQLEAALLNLVANARDAMNGAGGVEIRLRRSGGDIVLTVRDQGPGFDSAVLARVFDPFFTTKPVGQGTGLGLSQVYGLVKGAGGEVQAANAPAGGGLVTLSFPAAVGEEPMESEPALAVHHPHQQPIPGLASVLLVDDNDAVRITTAAFLRECGLSVIEASGPAQALKVLDTAKVEAMVSDIIMPGEMDGIALAERVHARRPALPILLVSGFSERAADAQAHGFTVVNKPYSLPDLERRLRASMDRAAAAVQG